MYQRNFRQNRKRLRRIDKFNALISNEKKIVNDVNRENKILISQMNKFKKNQVYIAGDMIDAIIDYITRKINNKRYKLIKTNETEQGIKYINHNFVTLNAQYTQNLRKVSMILSDS